MLPFPIISKTEVLKVNTIIQYLQEYTSVPITVVGAETDILYDPSPFYYTDGYNAIRIIRPTSYVQIGTGGVPSAFQINNNTNFKIETSVYLTGTSTQMLIGNLINGTGTGSYWITLNNTYQVPSQISLDGYSTTGAVQRFRFGTSGSTKMPTDQWVKIKLERVGSLLSFFINDVQIGASQTMTLGFQNTSGNVMKLGSSTDNTYQLLGAIDSFVMSTSSV